MYGFVDVASISKSVIDFLTKRINLDAVVEKIISVIFISILMYFSIKIGNKLIKKFVDRQVASKKSFSLEPQKALTIGEVLKSVLKYTVYIIGIGSMLYDILAKIPVALASAGGFAIGLGAQSLVKDLINGFFVLFEDQYGVGDHVTIGQFSGIVESIGIRTTVLRDFTGDLHLIPNGSVLEVTNHSRGDIRFIVDVEIAYEENIDAAIEVIKKANTQFEEKYEDKLRGEIDVLGVLSLNASGVTIRVVGRAEPLSQWEMERELRKEIKVALDEAGIEIPYPKTAIVNKTKNYNI
ncbi:MULTISPECIES: mechanosensitive ion channel family protein [unclassified Clostridium]|jgi:small-conductance mechanosensitive channel|uniref:mechanosensitive ion channel family protein n=1 Tax=Clostridium TaxID=1485 RepID=UPI001C8CBB5C|nr:MULTISPECIES: mechanosensitive ion channel family protein [unclassified Clostridium]MBX9138700.1 mechanosensitive ion channel family protein [Clostridium sp. K12(2020)]MBX9145522.1 mechanosensitive ion channel family protein [Clostridium sp. K13]MDU2290682.1 mechanosensitive ion channel family protein [Clostridium celatum]MDU4325011.1 mechanosensitive ion channel family protein [Clostridium celatum]